MVAMKVEWRVKCDYGPAIGGSDECWEVYEQSFWIPFGVVIPNFCLKQDWMQFSQGALAGCVFCPIHSKAILGHLKPEEVKAIA